MANPVFSTAGCATDCQRILRRFPQGGPCTGLFPLLHGLFKCCHKNGLLGKRKRSQRLPKGNSLHFRLPVCAPAIAVTGAIFFLKVWLVGSLQKKRDISFDLD